MTPIFTTLESLTIADIAIIILSIAVIVLAIALVMMHRKLSRFLVNIDSRNIGDSLEHLKKETADLAHFRSELEKYLEKVEKRLRRSVQSVHTLRFNPFKGTGSGGNQSFATVFLNEDGDGVIISSLYSREHVSVFSKPINTNKPEFDLSEEETTAFENAKKRIV